MHELERLALYNGATPFTCELCGLDASTRRAWAQGGPFVLLRKRQVDGRTRVACTVSGSCRLRAQKREVLVPEDEGVEASLLRGPFTIVVDLDEAWPKSNLIAGGCKHDVFMSDAKLLAGGLVVRCCKCGAVVISRGTLDRLVAERAEFDG